MEAKRFVNDGMEYHYRYGKNYSDNYVINDND